MAINTIKATMQMRNGMEDDFDPTQMTAGEWAVSRDTKYVRMCFMPGLCLRMATYEAFEQDMQRIQQILSECQDIKTAVQEFVRLAEQHKTKAEHYSILSRSWAVGGTGERAGEDTNNSMYHSKQSESYAHGGTGLRIGEDVDNSEYYSRIAAELVEEAKRIVAAATKGALIPAGTIPFENLPMSPMVGFMYNISNDFITDDRFEDGAGVFYTAGNNVYWNTYGKWDVLTGIQSYDFVGTKAEMDAKLAAGELTDGMKVYLKDVGGDSSGGGEIPEDLQQRIESLEEKTQINTFDNAGIVAKAIKPYKLDLNSGYPLERTYTWQQVPSKGAQPSWYVDWRAEYTFAFRSEEVVTGKEIVLSAGYSPMYYILEFQWINANIGTYPKKILLDTTRIFREMQYYGNYGKVAEYELYDGDSQIIVEEFKIYDVNIASIGNFMVAFHFAKRDTDTNYSYRFIIDKYTVTGLRSGLTGKFAVSLHGHGTSEFS